MSYVWKGGDYNEAILGKSREMRKTEFPGVCFLFPNLTNDINYGGPICQ
jgi:hypothetical protein